jgi:hypothetical protein
VPEGGWTVLQTFDYTPDGTSEPRHVEPDDRVDDISEERAQIFINLGLLAP